MELSPADEILQDYPGRESKLKKSDTTQRTEVACTLECVYHGRDSPTEATFKHCNLHSVEISEFLDNS